MNTSLPNPQTPVCSQFADDWASIVQSVCLAGLLFSMALVVEFDEFKQYFKKPTPLFIGLASQFFIMPLICFGLAHVDIAVPYKLGLVALGCSPGGSLSNMVCMVAGADLNLSIAMTTASHFVAVVMLPLNLFLYIQLSGLASNVCLSVGGIIVSAVMIASGTGLGLYVSPHLSLLGMKLGTLFGTACGLVILLLGFLESSLSNYPVWSTPPTVVGLAILPSALGMIFGLSVASACRLPKPQRVTVAVETGVQNKFISIASVSAIFAAGDNRNMALSVPIIYATFAGFVAYGMAIFMWKAFGWSDLPRDADLCFACKRLAKDIHDKKSGKNKKNKQKGEGIDIVDEIEAAVEIVTGDGKTLGGTTSMFSSKGEVDVDGVVVVGKWDATMPSGVRPASPSV